MSGTTDNPNDPDIKCGPPDETPVPMNNKYLVLSEVERAKGFIRPLRDSYVHVGTDPVMHGPILIRVGKNGCGGRTTMGGAIAATYARDPYFYGATYCVHCQMHRPVGPMGEFVWDDGEKVGT